jgi:HlyD family secretion protein
MANHQKNRRRRWLIVSGIIAVLVLGMVGLAAALRPSHKIDPSKLAKAEMGDITQGVVATGRIEPLTKVEVKSKASGIVKKLYVDVGDRVRTGEVLVELDRDQLQANVREGKAQLASAQAALLAAKATYEQNRVEARGPDVPFLKLDADRAQKLYGEGLIPKSQRDSAEQAYQVALNKQQSAQGAVAVSRAKVEEAKAQVSVAEAALEQAEENLRYATITSPMDGIVLSRDVEVGDAVSSILVLGSQATLIMMLGDTSQVYLKGKVDEADIGKVYVGQAAKISVESFKNRKFEGKVTKISPLGVEKDNVTTFEVRVSIQNSTGELRANMSANAEIVEREKHNVLLVPEAAIAYNEQSQPFVEVPDPNAETGFRKVPVKLGISNGVKSEILAGVKSGEKVILQ